MDLDDLYEQLPSLSWDDIERNERAMWEDLLRCYRKHRRAVLTLSRFSGLSSLSIVLSIA